MKTFKRTLAKILALVMIVSTFTNASTGVTAAEDTIGEVITATVETDSSIEETATADEGASSDEIAPPDPGPVVTGADETADTNETSGEDEFTYNGENETDGLADEDFTAEDTDEDLDGDLEDDTEAVNGEDELESVDPEQEIVTIATYVGETMITVRFEEDAFDGPVTLDAYEITRYQREYAQVEAAVEDAIDDDLTIDDVEFAAFDIFFIDEDGFEVEPAEGKYVSVTISTVGKETPDDVTDVLHITEYNEVEVLATETTGTTVEFETDSFSIYILIGGSNYDNKSTSAYLYSTKNNGGTTVQLNNATYYPMGEAGVSFKINSHDVTYTLDATDPVVAGYEYSSVYYIPYRSKVASWNVFRRYNDGAVDIEAVLENGSKVTLLKTTNTPYVNNGNRFAWIVDDPETKVVPAYHYERVPFEHNYNLSDMNQLNQKFSRYTVNNTNIGNKIETTVKMTSDASVTDLTMSDGLTYDEVWYRAGDNEYYDYEFVRVTGFSMPGAGGNDWRIEATLEDGSKVLYCDANSTEAAKRFVWIEGTTGFRSEPVEVKLYLRVDKNIPAGTAFANGVDNLHAVCSNGNYLPKGDNTPYFYPENITIDMGQVLANGGKIFSHVGNDISNQEQQYFTHITSGWGQTFGSKDEAHLFFCDVIFPAMDKDSQEKILNTFGKLNDGTPNYIGYVLKWEANYTNARVGTNNGDAFWHLDGAPYVSPMWMVELYEGTPNENAYRTLINHGKDATIPTFDGPTAYANAKVKFETHFRDVKFAGKQIEVKWGSNGKDNYNGVITEVATGKKTAFHITPENGGSGVDNSGTVTYKEMEKDVFWLAIFTVEYEDVPTGSVAVKKNLAGDAQEAGVANSTFTFTITREGENAPLALKAVDGGYTVSDNGDTTQITVTGAGSAAINGLDVNATYIISENTPYVPENFDVSVTMNPADGRVTITNANQDVNVTVTNTYTKKTGTLTIEKKVVDNTSGGNFADKTYTFTVTGPDGYNETVTIKGAGSVTIDDVPAGDYTVTEAEISEAGFTVTATYAPAGGKVTVPANGQASVTVTNTAVREQDSVKIEGKKTWLDDKEKASDRPALQIKVTGTVDGSEVFSNTYTFARGAESYKIEGLDKYDLSNGKVISYSVEEIVPSGYDKIEEKANDTNGKDFTNRIQQKEITISGTKTWVDDKTPATRPQYTVALYRNGDEVDRTVINGNVTTYSFKNLPYYDEKGQPYRYEVKEVDIPADYEVTETENSTGGKDFTNTIKQKETTISGEKTWKDPADAETVANRPELTIRLFRNGRLYKEQSFGKGATSYEFTNLPVYNVGDDYVDYVKEGDRFEYTVEEVKPDGYKKTGETKNATGGKDLVNTIEEGDTQVSGNKNWIDPYGADSSKRPHLVVTLLQNGKPYKTEDFGAGATSYVFNNLPKFDENGQLYVYTVEEVEVEGYTTARNGNDFTNTIKQEPVSIEGTKTWIDPYAETPERRPAVTIVLVRDGEDTDQTFVIENGGDHYEFKNLDKYDLTDGHEYIYTVREEEVEKYTSVIDKDGNITNTIDQVYTSVSGFKTWNDPYENDNDRPELKVNLYQDGGQEPYRTGTFGKGGKNYAFTDLPVYDLTDGHMYVYTVEEVLTDDRYEKTAEKPNLTKGKDFENTIKQEYTSVSGAKTWYDAEKNAENRPDLIVDVYRNEETTPYRTVNAGAGATSYEIGNLPVYNVGDAYTTAYEKGAKFTYTVKERVPAGYEMTQDGDNFTNTITQDYIDIEGTKTWNDPGDEETIKNRPELTVVVKQNGREYRRETFAQGAEAYKFEKLPVYNVGDDFVAWLDRGTKFVYDVEEIVTGDYHQTADPKNETYGRDFVNTINPDFITISGSKTWVDPHRTNNTARPHLVVTITRNDGWTKKEDFGAGATRYEFKDLERYDENGQRYVYTVEEVTVDGYTVTEQANQTNGKDFTNTINQDYKNISGDKTWIAPEGKERPTIEIVLLRDGVKADSVKLENGATHYEFNDLPLYDINDVVEGGENDGHAFDYKVEELEIEGYTSVKNADDDFTNTIDQQKVKVSGVKNWVDPYKNTPQDRKAHLSVDLHRNGDYQKTEDFGAGATTYEFTDLDRYDENGQEYIYTVVEHVAGYTQTFASERTVDADGNVTQDFENTINQRYTTKTVTKNWIDPDVTHPEITITLLQDGVEYDTVTLGGDNDDNESHTFINLPVYDVLEDAVKNDGHIFEYTVEETVPEGYTMAQEGDVITNTISQDYIDIEGTKTWNDPADEETIKNRPALQIRLFRDDELIETKTFSKGAESYKFEHLPLYDIEGAVEGGKNDGHAFDYRVEEVKPEGYTMTAEAENDTNGKDFVNTIEQDETSITGTKEWIDAYDNAADRPDLIVTLYRNGVKVETKSFGRGATSFHFGRLNPETEPESEKLDKYDANGKPYVYTVKEEAVDGYATTMEENNHIANKMDDDPTPEKEVNGKKEEILEGDRHQTVTYTVKSEVPALKLLTQFVLTDRIEDVLEFAGRAKVTVNGTAVNSEITQEDNVLTVILTGKTLEDTKGKTVEVTFDARIRQDADLSGYYAADSGRVEVPNKAYYTLVFPEDGPGTRTKETEEVIITPPDVDIKKTIEGGEDNGTHKTLKNRNEEVTFVLETQIPERNALESFTITDILEPVLEFVSTEDDVEVTVGAGTVYGTAAITGQTLTVTIDGALAEGKGGQEVTVKFAAKIRDDADNLSAYIGKVTDSGVVEVPNDASYVIRFDGKTEEKSTDKVYVTPPDTTPEKTANGSKEETEIVREEEVTYTITTRVPERKASGEAMTAFAVTDALEHVLTVTDVKVIVGGSDLTSLAQKESVKDLKDRDCEQVKVTLTGETLSGHIGDAVTVTIKAQIKEDADLSEYISAAYGKPEIPNKAFQTITLPDGVKESETNEPVVIPDDPKPEKTANGEKEHYDMKARDEEINYQIKVLSPERDNIDSFVIEDTIEDVLAFSGAVSVTLNGQTLRNASRTEGQKLTVTIPANLLNQNANKGKEVVVTFKAVIREGADLTPYMEESEDGRAKIPNQASYTMTIGDEVVTKVTNIPTVTPKDPDPEKTVNGAAEATLNKFDEIFTYEITTGIPVNGNATSFTLTDTLEPVLEFVSAEDEVTVTIAGEPVKGIAKINGQTLTVTLTGEEALKASMGRTMTVTFEARIKKGQDVTDYIIPDTEGKIAVPNTASYRLDVPNGAVTGMTEEVIVITDPEYIDITVSKTWDDGDNRDAVRPDNDEVTIILTADGEQIDEVKLNKDNNLRHTFAHLRKYTDEGKLIAYVATEQGVPVIDETHGYTLAKEGEGTTYTYDEDGALTGADFTNVYTPGRTDVTVRKVWEDDADRWSTRPASITVRLYANGEAAKDVAPLTLNAANGWSGRFEALFLKEDGKTIEYTVVEDAVDGYDVTYTVSEDNAYDFTITNTLHTGTLNVRKSVVGAVGGNVTYTFIVTHVATGSEYARVTITGSGTRTLNDVPVGTYRITEVGAGTSTVAGYTMTTTGNGQSVTIAKDGTASVTITNTYTAIPVPEDTPPTPTPTPTPTPVVPAEPPAVLGARRTDGEAVLGARRGKTGEARKERRLIMTLAASAVGLLLAATDRRKKKN